MIHAVFTQLPTLQVIRDHMRSSAFLPLVIASAEIEIEYCWWPNVFPSPRRIDWYTQHDPLVTTWRHVILTWGQILALTFKVNMPLFRCVSTREPLWLSIPFLYIALFKSYSRKTFLQNKGYIYLSWPPLKFRPILTQPWWNKYSSDRYRVFFFAASYL